jgi:hypothetical protein
VTKSPCGDQSEKSIKRWLRSNIKVGAMVAIRRIEDRKLYYERAIVLSVRPKNFNVATLQRDQTPADAHETFDHSGINWRSTKAPTRVVLPTPAVLEACDVCDFGTASMPGDAETYTYSVR